MQIELSSVQEDTSIQCRAAIDTDVVNEYAERMNAGDAFPPIILYGTTEKAWIGDGWHRLMAYKQTGARSIEVDLRPGGRVDALRCALGANAAHGHRRTNADKRRAVEIALAEWPKLPAIKIAEICGVSQPFVSAMKNEDITVIPSTVTGRDGKEYPATRREAAAESPPPPPHVAQNTGDNEWYTPAAYVEAARTVMGGIDLDPASSAEANEVVRAASYYTAAENGLTREWAGRIFMNPPYAAELIGKFIEKLALGIETGNVTDAITLVNNATDTRWFARLASCATHLCFPTGRVVFWHPRKESTPLQGQAIAYAGGAPDMFVEVFSQFGLIAKVLR